MPIRRNELLAPLSREHHHGLLLCWKIRTGYRKNIAVDRMQSYATWFYKTFLIDHFNIEEKYVFSVLGNDNPLVKQALMEHRKLRVLFEKIHENEKNLGLIEEKLEAHIRFEERVLFNEIQQAASPEQLKEITEKHSEQTSMQNIEEWTDEFWR